MYRCHYPKKHQDCHGASVNRKTSLTYIRSELRRDIAIDINFKADETLSPSQKTPGLPWCIIDPFPPGKVWEVKPSAHPDEKTHTHQTGRTKHEYFVSRKCLDITAVADVSAVTIKQEPRIVVAVWTAI